MLGVYRPLRAATLTRRSTLIGRAMGPLANYADAHLNLGNAHHVARRPQEAIASYRRAIALKPELAAAHSSLARDLNAMGAFAKALLSAERAIKLEPSVAEAWLHAGAALRALGRLTEAEACLREAVARRPDFPRPCRRSPSSRSSDRASWTRSRCRAGRAGASEGRQRPARARRLFVPHRGHLGGNRGVATYGRARSKVRRGLDGPPAGPTARSANSMMRSPATNGRLRSIPSRPRRGGAWSSPVVRMRTRASLSNSL